MTKLKGRNLTALFDEKPPAATAAPQAGEASSGPEPVAPAPRRDSHPGKRGVMIYIPDDMHRTLRQLSVEEGGEPITKVVERGLRDYLVAKGYTKYG